MSSSCLLHVRPIHHTTPYHITPSLRTTPHHTTPQQTTPPHNTPQYVPAFSRQSITPPLATACILTAPPISESLHCFTPPPPSLSQHAYQHDCHLLLVFPTPLSLITCLPPRTYIYPNPVSARTALATTNHPQPQQHTPLSELNSTNPPIAAPTSPLPTPTHSNSLTSISYLSMHTHHIDLHSS